MKRIYFAGSVGRGDWRNGLALEATGRIMSNGYATYTARSGGKFIYGGPFAVSDDHGCFHAGEHGFGPAGCTGSFIDGEGIYSKDIEVEGDSSFELSFVFSRSQYQIRECDAVFVNIDKVACYGTYLEIGYASALEKPIFIFCSAVAPKQGKEGEHGVMNCNDDLWFIKRAGVMLDKLEIPECLLEYPKSKYNQYLESDKWKEIARMKRNEAGGRCQLCNDNKGRLNVHHRTYDNIYQEKMDDLIVLCDKCHTKFHEQDVNDK
jgi:nucleoside 2-deoxyribosyltransferase